MRYDQPTLSTLLEAPHIRERSPAAIRALTGRPGPDGGIEQEGAGPDGRPIRWLFTELDDTRFRWLGYGSDDGGASWRLEQEMVASRRDRTADDDGSDALRDRWTP